MTWKRIRALLAGAVVVAMSSMEAVGQKQPDAEDPAIGTAEPEAPAFFRFDELGAAAGSLMDVDDSAEKDRGCGSTTMILIW